MLKYILFLSLFMLAGCGACERAKTYFTGGLTYKCSRYGTEYVQSDSGLALSIDGSGMPVKCNP
jgi:hypothetical protein